MTNIRNMHETNWVTSTFPVFGVLGLSCAMDNGGMVCSIPATVGGVRTACFGESENTLPIDLSGLTKIRVAVKALNSASAGQRVPMELYIEGNGVGEGISDETIEGENVATIFDIDGDQLGEVFEIGITPYSGTNPVLIAVTTIDGIA